MDNAPAVAPDILQPTYVGYVHKTLDACLLMEMTLAGGPLQHVPRRPHERERSEIIKSGHVFIYSESISGIKRWTDGLNWSPSRILGNFLIYREVDSSFPGEGGKKVALKRNRTAPGSKPSGIQKREKSPPIMSSSIYNPYRVDDNITGPSSVVCPPAGNELCYLEDRDLLGSLTDSYPFLPNGLMKKTITFLVNGVNHHMVSYYNPQHVRTGQLKTPSTDPRFENIRPRVELIKNPGFRVAVETEEYKINENSEAYITQAQAQAQAHAQGQLQMQGFYQQPQPQSQMQLYHPRAMSMHSHGLPVHGLPTAGMPNLSSYGQHPFNMHGNSPTVQGPQPFSMHTPGPLAGSLQQLAQTGMDAMGSTHYQQPAPVGVGFNGADEGAYDFGGSSSRQSSYLATPANVYSGAQNNVYAPAQEASYAPAHNPYTPAHNNTAYGPPGNPAYASQRDYRQPSITAGQQGYLPALPEPNIPNPSLSTPDMHGGLQGELKSEPADWNAAADYSGGSNQDTNAGPFNISAAGTGQPIPGDLSPNNTGGLSEQSIWQSDLSDSPGTVADDNVPATPLGTASQLPSASIPGEKPKDDGHGWNLDLAEEVEWDLFNGDLHPSVVDGDDDDLSAAMGDSSDETYHPMLNTRAQAEYDAELERLAILDAREEGFLPMPGSMQGGTDEYHAALPKYKKLCGISLGP